MNPMLLVASGIFASEYCGETLAKKEMVILYAEACDLNLSEIEAQRIIDALGPFYQRTQAGEFPGSQEWYLRVVEPLSRDSWESLELQDNEGNEVKGALRIFALREFKEHGSMADVFFAETGALWETECPSTWGPKSKDDVDWTGFPLRSS